MIYNELYPMQKFIITDLLNYKPFGKYTSGYITYVDYSNLTKSYHIRVECLITKVGKNQKRFETQEFRVPPLVFKSLAKSSYYQTLYHVISEDQIADLSKAAPFEFFAWAYACVRMHERYSGKIHEECETLLKIQELGRVYHPDITENIVKNLFGNIEKRRAFLTELLKSKSFYKETYRKAFEKKDHILRSCLKSHYNTCASIGDHENARMINSYLESSEEERKALKETLHLERLDVLRRYKDSGHLF